ncbi:MAG TPA: hypothetical protein VHM94_04150 [Acidimicrobiia bacterium]|jgi:hypothetical protein|nr:hypothetical protein [Acidimicrobiia bacterium]
MIERSITGLAWHDLYACTATVHAVTANRSPRRERRRSRPKAGRPPSAAKERLLPGRNIEPPPAA